MSAPDLVVIVPQELALGFLLAGAETRVAEDAKKGIEVLDETLRGGRSGVVAVYEPYLEQLAPEKRQQLELSVSPVVIALPTGLEVEGVGARRARLVARLQRAIGYQVTFGKEEP